MNKPIMHYPIAEIFNSVQGEGQWTGTPMMFVRLAGCNVGRYGEEPFDGINNLIDNDFQLFADKKHSVCKSFDGQKFLCDTDYHKTSVLTIDEIFQNYHDQGHVCITGGEPFMHELQPLISYCLQHQILAHIETSGTITYPAYIEQTNVWLTCCPKISAPDDPIMYDWTDEWKVLVGPGFSIEKWVELDRKIPKGKPKYLQPINGVNEVWKDNLKHCLEILERWPGWRLSAQLHKYLEVR